MNPMKHIVEINTRLIALEAQVEDLQKKNNSLTCRLNEKFGVPVKSRPWSIHDKPINC